MKPLVKLEQAVATLEIECEYKRRKVFRSFFRLLMLCVRCEPRRNSITYTATGRNDNLNLRCCIALIDDFLDYIFYARSRRVTRGILYPTGRS